MTTVVKVQIPSLLSYQVTKKFKTCRRPNCRPQNLVFRKNEVMEFEPYRTLVSRHGSGCTISRNTMHHADSWTSVTAYLHVYRVQLN